MNTVDTVVIGAGHAGLAVSRLLTQHGRDHVVVDRGRVGERWRTERWDSLHLLTPNWMTRLPGWHHGGPDPHGFMSAARFVDHLERYAESFGAPVVGGTTVLELTRATAGGYRLLTDRGTWHARHVVIATGPHGVPRVPPALGGADVVTANRYRNPARLRPGGVLVVGASSSGVQIADELSRAGREVVLAVGRHTRMPRRYRGRDIFCWLHATGHLARTIHDVPDPAAARREPSLQLVGGGSAGAARPPRTLDLATLQGQGVTLVGRLEHVEGQRAHFAADLHDTVTAAEVRMHRVLDAVDAHVERAHLTARVGPPDRPGPVGLPGRTHALDLARAGFGTIVVATGYRPDYPWLRLPLLGPDGFIRQRRGVTDAPGVYVVGQRFQHRRDSGFIDGARHDATVVVRHLLTGSADPRAEGLPEEPAA